MATLPFAFFAMGIWLVVCFVAPCIARSATQEAGTGIDAEEGPGLQPRQSVLKSGGDSSSSDIAWNTGNGSNGFVFVTANSRPPVLLATGNEGSSVISWIRRGNYVFELYGDAERRTLLATVTVTGVATELEAPSQRNSMA